MCNAFIFLVMCCFFFFKQKTAYEMRISDWSSDVCSSDLQGRRAVTGGHAAIAAQVGAAGFELLQRRRSGVESSSSADGVGMPLTYDLDFLPVTRPATRFRRLQLREPRRIDRL